jgi:hypothetical protein
VVTSASSGAFQSCLIDLFVLSLDLLLVYSNHLNFEQQQIEIRSLKLLRNFDCVQWGFLYTGTWFRSRPFAFDHLNVTSPADDSWCVNSIDAGQCAAIVYDAMGGDL